MSIHTYFGLIRHAETTWNAEKRIQGQHETELTEAGIAAAEAWGASLATHTWDRILCSDLSRAVHTATIINTHLNISITTDRRLREQDWGTWVGRSIKQLRMDENGEVERQEAAGWDFTPTGGEPRHMVRDRVFTALLDAARRWQGERILVVTHLGCVTCVMNHLMEQTFTPDEPSPVAKRALQRIAFDGATFTILERNGAL